MLCVGKRWNSCMLLQYSEVSYQVPCFNFFNKINWQSWAVLHLYNFTTQDIRKNEPVNFRWLWVVSCIGLLSEIKLYLFCVVVICFKMVVEKVLVLLAKLKSSLWRQTIWEKTFMQNMVSSLHYGRRACVGTTYLKQCKWKPCGNTGWSVLPA